MNNNKLSITIISILVVLSIVILCLIGWNGIGFFKVKDTTKFSLQEGDLDIVYGNDDAILTIYMYSNYNCSFCQKFYNQVFPKLKLDYLDKNKVKLVIKPIELTNDESILYSLKIAVCINEYGNIEPLNKLLLNDPNIVYTSDFVEVTEELMDNDIYVAECMLNGVSTKYLDANIKEFRELELKGTPTFVINNKIVRGYIEYNSFRKIIEKELQYNLP